jgi:hypothetical protein
MYYSYVGIEYVATSFSPARMDLALKLLKHRKMEQCEQIFLACCVLHNFLLDQMVRNSVRVGRGYPIGDNGLWLDGNTVNIDINASERFLSTQFGMKRSLLAKHLHVF